MASLEELNNQFQSLQQIIQQQQEKNNNLERQLIEYRQDILLVENNLSNTKQELAQTNQQLQDIKQELEQTKTALENEIQGLTLQLAQLKTESNSVKNILKSPDGYYTFIIQNDGNIGIYSADGRGVWARTGDPNQLDPHRPK